MILESLFSNLTTISFETSGLISMRSSLIGPTGGELQAGLDGIYVKHKIIIPPNAILSTLFFIVDDPIDRTIFPFYTQRTAADWTPSVEFNGKVTLHIEYQPATDIPPGANESEIAPLFYKDGVMLPLDCNYYVDTINKIVVVEISDICESGIYALGFLGSSGPDGQVIGNRAPWISDPSMFW